jgi:hypothetical protein
LSSAAVRVRVQRLASSARSAGLPARLGSVVSDGNLPAALALGKRFRVPQRVISYTGRWRLPTRYVKTPHYELSEAFMTDVIPSDDTYSTATGETFIRVLPIDPRHAWIFWEAPLGAYRLVITAGDQTLVDQTIEGGEGDWFAHLDADGMAVSATVFDGDAAIAECMAVSLPAARAGTTPPRFGHLGTAPARRFSGATPSMIPVGTRYHGASEMRRRGEVIQAMARGERTTLNLIGGPALGGASDRMLTRTPDRGEADA